VCVNTSFCGFLSCDFVGGVSCDFAQCFGCVLIGVFVGDVCVKFCNSSTINNAPVAKSGHLLFSRPLNSHDDMTWALALAVSHSMRLPSSGAGAVMLPHSDRAKPFLSTPY
jgi:hypothetical protein